MGALLLTPPLLAEMIGLIDADTISGKIAKQILPDLLAVSVAGSRTMRTDSCRVLAALLTESIHITMSLLAADMLFVLECPDLMLSRQSS